MTTHDPSPETVAAIDRRSEVLRAHPDDFSANDALWRLVFGLEHWVFLTRSREEPHPLIAELREGTMLLAFTTSARAREGDLAAGLPGVADSLQLAVPLPGAIEWAAGFAAHHAVDGILFDHPSQGYFALLRNLIPMRDWMAQHPPL